MTANDWQPGDDWLAKGIKDREVVRGQPFTCDRCGHIFEGPLLDAATGETLIPGHIKGHPKLCVKRGGYVRDGRERKR